MSWRSIVTACDRFLDDWWCDTKPVSSAGVCIRQIDEQFLMTSYVSKTFRILLIDSHTRPFTTKFLLPIQSCYDARSCSNQQGGCDLQVQHRCYIWRGPTSSLIQSQAITVTSTVDAFEGMGCSCSDWKRRCPYLRSTAFSSCLHHGGHHLHHRHLHSYR